VTNIIRKSFGVLVIDGIVMHSPATIDTDRPGEFKILYDPKECNDDQVEQLKQEAG